MVKIKVLIKDFKDGEDALSVVIEPSYSHTTAKEKKLGAAYLIYLAQISERLKGVADQINKNEELDLDLDWEPKLHEISTKDR